MALSQREQQILEGIAGELCVDDPRLARKLATTTSSAWLRRRQRIGAAAAFTAGLVMLSGAILIPREIVCGVLIVSVCGYLVMFGAAMRWATVSRGCPSAWQWRDRGQRMDGMG